MNQNREAQAAPKKLISVWCVAATMRANNLCTDMATYTVAPRSNQAGFDVAVIGDDGARQTMLGFKTKAEAEAWIDDDKKREAPAAEGLLMLRRLTRAKPFILSPSPQIRQAK